MGNELKIDIYSDLFMPYFFYKCSCSKMGECSLQEYANGLTILKKKSFGELKTDYNKIKEKLINVELKDKSQQKRNYYEYDEDQSDEFKKFYFWLFEFNIENKSEKKDKKISFEIAKFFWEQLFCSYGYVKHLINFIENEKKLQFVKLDQWNCLLELIRHFKQTFPNEYNLEDCWPTLFDDFYIWYCLKNGIEYKKPENLEY